jgi:hypothetical protein
MKTQLSIALCTLIVALGACSMPVRVIAGEVSCTSDEPWIVAQVEYPSSRQEELERPSYRQQQLENVEEPPPAQYQQPAYNYNQEVYEENLERRGITTQRLRGTRYYR